MTEVTVIEAEPDQPLTLEPEAPPTEVLNTAVEIAQIQADTTIELATIEATVDLERIAAQSQNSEVEQRWTDLALTLQAMSLELSQISQRLSVLETIPEPVIVETAEPVVESLEVMPDNLEEVVAEPETVSVSKVRLV